MTFIIIDVLFHLIHIKKVVDKHIKDDEILNALKSKIDSDKKMAYDKTNLLGLF